MVGVLQLIAENSEMILIVISLVFAIIARYFQTQSDAIREAAQAVTDLTQSVLDAVRDGVVSKEELDTMVARIAAAQKEIQEVIDIFFPPATITEKITAVVFGYKRERLDTLKLNVQSLRMQNMIMKARK
jgi:hypothetical protein